MFQQLTLVFAHRQTIFLVPHSLHLRVFEQKNFWFYYTTLTNVERLQYDASQFNLSIYQVLACLSATSFNYNSFKTRPFFAHLFSLRQCPLTKISTDFTSFLSRSHLTEWDVISRWHGMSRYQLGPWLQTGTKLQIFEIFWVLPPPKRTMRNQVSFANDLETFLCDFSVCLDSL